MDSCLIGSPKCPQRFSVGKPSEERDGQGILEPICRFPRIRPPRTWSCCSITLLSSLLKPISLMSTWRSRPFCGWVCRPRILQHVIVIICLLIRRFRPVGADDVTARERFRKCYERRWRFPSEVVTRDLPLRDLSVGNITEVVKLFTI